MTSPAPEHEDLLRELDPEMRTRALGPRVGRLAAALAASLCLYAFYWTQFPVTTQAYRASFLGLALVATFVIYPAGGPRGVFAALCLGIVPLLAGVIYAVKFPPHLPLRSFNHEAVPCQDFFSPHCY